MDDSRKRVSRERLEPYFRLHRDAHLNIIRNWVGQDTEETFYELAGECGLMVCNDFLGIDAKLQHQIGERCSAAHTPGLELFATACHGEVMS